jgi:ribosomal-protein-alanine N-acetyltransferase
MMESIEIIEAGAKDLDEVMTVMYKAFDPRNGEAWTAAQCAGALSLPNSILFVARSQRRALGFALARSVADEAELLLIAVRPDGQRRGAGRALIAKVVEHYSLQGVKKLHLEVRTDNPALAFYDRLGFEQVGLRRNYYRRSNGELTDAATLSVEIERF